ncbi:hypothetical protein I79_006373 [Cricetulus griseus]|uniref:Uncharacterized protein n=1 Tax=Cricetulus griseus TaxID=10029 RepID=G3H7N8_CRIGR|nr:hypothetical protein I79_006373 [Cricetulus griseus]
MFQPTNTFPLNGCYTAMHETNALNNPTFARPSICFKALPAAPKRSVVHKQRGRTPRQQ